MGTVKSVTISQKSVATATDYTMGNTGSLSKGTWLIIAQAAFTVNTAGRRAMYLTNSSTGSNLNRMSRIVVAPSPSQNTELLLPYLAGLDAATTFYLRVYQNCGSSLNVTGGFSCIKLSDLPFTL